MSTTPANRTAEACEHNTSVSTGHEGSDEYHEVHCDDCGYSAKWASPTLAALDSGAHARTGQRMAEPGTCTAIFNADERWRAQQRGATRAEMRAAIEAADSLSNFDSPRQHPAVVLAAASSAMG